MGRFNHDVLLLNTFAGSLAIGASAIDGVSIRGSYEDKGYGAEIVAANFPKIDQVNKYEEWPKQDLRRTVVIAHPPCSAFSIQNRSADAKGTGAAKFKCTVQVMEYAMSNRCAALAIESVPGALEGAREEHDRYARRYDYVPYRILQNAVTFGVPQWRPRFWVIFLPKPRQWFEVYHDPSYKKLSAILDKKPRKNDYIPYVYDGFHKQRKLLLKTLSKSIVDGIFFGEYGHGPLQRIIFRNALIKDVEDWRDCDPYCLFGTTFTSDCMMVLNPELYSNTMLCGSFLTALGRALTRSEYKRIMGFPAGYKFPTSNTLKRMRCFLAQGVVPPVATWLLKNILFNLKDHEQPTPIMRCALAPGEIADLRIKRTQFPGAKKDRRQFDLFEEEFA